MEIARAVVVATSSAEDRPWPVLGGRKPKPLAPVATKPVLFHTLDALRAAGVLEAALLVEPDAAPLFKRAVGRGRAWGIKLTYAACGQDVDVRRALHVAREFVQDEPVIVQRADVILRGRLREHVADFAREDLDALALMLVRPQMSTPPPTACGGYLLSPAAVASALDAPAGHELLAHLRRYGSHVRVLDVEGCLACRGDEASLLEANRHALASIRTAVDGATLEGCEIQGPVIVHETASLVNTLVRGPAIIGPGTRVVNSYVGPYTAVGAGVLVEGTEIEHSIVMDHAQLLFVGSRLETSIIGRGASIVRRFDMPSAVRMSIGDGAHVALS